MGETWIPVGSTVSVGAGDSDCVAPYIAEDDKPMLRAGQKNSTSPCATTETSPHPGNATVVAIRLLEDSLPAFDAREAADEAAAQLDDRSPQMRALESAIRQRIEQRLQGRVRNLVVHVAGATVTLEGQCSTFYSKQLAQHAAMGVLEEEHLENSIVVSVPK